MDSGELQDHIHVLVLWFLKYCIHSKIGARKNVSESFLITEQFCSRNKALIAEGLAKSKSCLWIFVVVFCCCYSKKNFSLTEKQMVCNIALLSCTHKQNL